MQNRSNAEDLMQETFLKAFRKIHRYNPKYAFTTWLFTIANRLAASAWRKHRPMAEDLPDVQDEAPCPASLTEQNDTRENLWTHARQLLNDAQYAVLWLHYGEDLPVKEIARALRRTSTGVKVLLHRARNNLGHSLADTSHNPRQPDLAALPTTS
jgi:RNA polymerase sigma-70 factor (ECF subfamily)